MASRRRAAGWLIVAPIAALIAACGTENAGTAGSSGNADSLDPDAPTSAPATSPSPAVTDDASPTGPTGSPRPTSGDSALTIIVVDGPGAQPRTWDLSCDPVGGTHPDPAGACAAILAAPGDPFAAVPPNTICTEIYGGPQEAFVKGYWEGERIDATFTRQNGCEIARWDRLLAVFRTPTPTTFG